MNFQPPNMPLGMPPMQTAPTVNQNSFMPPKSATANATQHLATSQQQIPNNPQQQQNHQYQPPVVSGVSMPQQQQQHHLLTNGASKASSRTASPAPPNNNSFAVNQPNNPKPASSHLLPPSSANFRPPTSNLAQLRQPQQMANASVQNHFPPNNIQQSNMPNLTAAMQNVAINNGVNGPPDPLANGNYSAAGSNRTLTTPQQPNLINGQHMSPRYPAIAPQSHHPQPQLVNAPPPNNTNPIQSPPGPPLSNVNYYPPTSDGVPPKTSVPKRPAYPQVQPQSQQQYQHLQQQPQPNQIQSNPNFPTQQQQLQPNQYATAPTMQQQPHQYQAPPPAFNGQPMSAAAASSPLQYQNQFNNFDGSSPISGGGGPVQHGFNKLWGQQNMDLMQTRHVLPPIRVKPPPVELGHEFYESVNCSPELVFLITYSPNTQ